MTSISLGLGWDPVKPSGFFSKMLGGGGNDIDLDASCILLDGDMNSVDLVWFRQLASRDGAIEHSGDNLTGEGDGDDETIHVDLQRLPGTIQHLVFTVNSFRGQTFDQVENAYCRILDDAQDKELARFNLAEKGRHTGCHGQPQPWRRRLGIQGDRPVHPRPHRGRSRQSGDSGGASMTTLVPGGNAPVATGQLRVDINYAPIPGAEIDISAFALTAAAKVRGDGDMCFYGQTSVRRRGSVDRHDGRPCNVHRGSRPDRPCRRESRAHRDHP